MGSAGCPRYQEELLEFTAPCCELRFCIYEARNKQKASSRQLSAEWISSTALLPRTNTSSFPPAQQVAVVMGLLLHSSFRALLSCAGCLRESPCSHTPRKSPSCLPTIRCLMGLHHGAVPGVVLAVTFSILLTEMPNYFFIWEVLWLPNGSKTCVSVGTSAPFPSLRCRSRIEMVNRDGNL